MNRRYRGSILPGMLVMAVVVETLALVFVPGLVWVITFTDQSDLPVAEATIEGEAGLNSDKADINAHN